METKRFMTGVTMLILFMSLFIFGCTAKTETNDPIVLRIVGGWDKETVASEWTDLYQVIFPHVEFEIIPLLSGTPRKTIVLRRNLLLNLNG